MPAPSSTTTLGVFNGVSQETVLAGAGNILTSPLVVKHGISVVRFTIAGTVAAIYTLTGWASFPVSINDGVAIATKTFVIEVREGMSLNITSDSAGTFKVIGSEVIGGVI